MGGKAGQGNSYRAVIGFCRKRLLQGLGCTERASQLLSCGEGCFIELEQHTGQKFLPQRSRIFCASDFSKAGFFLCKWEQSAGKTSYRGAVGSWAWWPLRRPGYTEGASRLIFCGVGREQGTGKKSYRGAVGFWGWWPFRRPGYTEGASRLLFCGEGWLIGREQGTGKKSYRGVKGFWASGSSGGWPSPTQNTRI